MAYRDSFDQCPRCGVDLVDAGSVRACRGCGGQLVAEDVLTDMLLAMLPLGPPHELVVARSDRDDDPLACPTCGARMDGAALHGVVLDRCPKQHGVWFDRAELQQALARVGALRRDRGD